MTKMESMVQACTDATSPMTGAQLRWIRKRLLVLNINALAEQLEVARGTIRRWEMSDSVGATTANAVRYLLIDKLSSDEEIEARIEHKIDEDQDEDEGGLGP